MPTPANHGSEELRAARRANHSLLLSVFLFSVFVNLLMLTGPLFMLQVYDRVLSSRSGETLTALFLLVVALYAMMGILDYARGRVLARFGARFQTALDDRAFQAVLTRAVEPGNRAKPDSGLRDLETIQTAFTSPAILAFFDLPWTPVFLVAIFIFHPVLGWLALGSGAILVVVAALNNFMTRKRTLEAQKAAAQAQGFADQARASAEIVRSQGMGAAISERWRRQRDSALVQTVGVSDWTGLFTAGTKAFRLLIQSAMLAAGAWLVLRYELTAGAMIAGSILLGRALAPIELAIGQWGGLQRGTAAWRSLAQTLGEIPPPPATLTLPRPEAVLSVKGVHAYVPGTRRPTLQDIDFSVQPGEALGVIGKSGSGKSTLARVIVGLIAPAAGEVRLGGATLEQYDSDALGSFVGYLPQEVTLFAGTVAENIARMSIMPDDEKVVEAAVRAKAHEMILALPDGYQTVVHGNDNQLSGGQRQRVALARALYDDPVLLVLDEPNSALDGDGSEALNRAVREFKDTRRAVVIMTHRPLAISECERLIVIDGGRVKAEGPRDKVLKTTVKNADRITSKIRKVDTE